jgi:hypothetical protein
VAQVLYAGVHEIVFARGNGEDQTMLVTVTDEQAGVVGVDVARRPA